jgi:class 3 adenylate cyclase
MNLFLISIKLFAISIIFGFLNQAQALEFKPTHIITDNSPVEISGEELVWSDNTGILKLNDILKLISDFKNPALISKTVDLNTQEASDVVTWQLSVVKNDSNKDISLRVHSSSNSSFFGKKNEEPSTVYLLKDNELVKSIDTDTYGNYNNLAIFRWNREHKDNKSRYETVLIPKNESVQILRRIGKTSDINSNFLRLSEHQAELEINRLSLYLQGIAAGGFLVFIFLSFFSAINKIEKSNKFFFFWVLTGLLYILLSDLDGDRFSEFLLGKNSEENYIEQVKFIVGYSLFELSHILFILLLSNLIDIKKNFPTWSKTYLVLIISSMSLGLVNYLLELPLLDFNKEVPEAFGRIFRSLYFIIAYIILGVGLISATITLYIRKFPQAIYLLMSQIFFILGFFNYDFLNIALEGKINFDDVFLISELAIFIKISLFLLQALVLNFSIIRKMKFLQMEVIAIGDKNRQILADQNQILEVKVKERTQELHLESQKSERLMLNILPQSIASRLKAGDDGISDSYQNATILFSDLVGFTKMSSAKTAEELVFLLNDLFKRFDTRATSLGLEKIKTIGDAYMVAGGLPTQDDSHAIQVTKMALGMYEDLEAFNKEHGVEIDMRIGINSGPVVAGVIGHSKFSYDLWGNTVNTASRMESTCLPGKVQVSPSTYEQIKGHFDVQENQMIECKGLGQIMTYFVK